MNCAIHPDQLAAGRCALCGRDLCGECQVVLGEKAYCRDCLAERVTGPDRSIESTAEVAASAVPLPESDTAAPPLGEAAASLGAPRLFPPKGRFWSFVFSLVPGVGHMYLELMQRGLSILILFFGAVTLSILLEAGEVMALVGPVLYFYSVFDALQLRRRINAREPVADKPIVTWKQVESLLNLKPGQTQSLVAYGLIFLGATKLLQNFVPRLYRFFNFSPLPLLFILAGIWLLANPRIQRKEQGQNLESNQDQT